MRNIHEHKRVFIGSQRDICKATFVGGDIIDKVVPVRGCGPEGRVAPVLDGRTAWLALTGRGGVGKTATARAVIAELRDCTDRRGGRLVLLAGECPEAKGEKADAAYAPFQKALARYFEVNLLAPPEAQLEHIDSALDGLFESVVPFSGLRRK